MCRLHLRIRANRIAFPWQHITLKGASDAAPCRAAGLGNSFGSTWLLFDLPAAAVTPGATHEEVMRAMPGDDLQQKPIFNATRAITIGARPEEVWAVADANGLRERRLVWLRPDRQ